MAATTERAHDDPRKWGELSSTDCVIVSLCCVAVTYITLSARWVPGWSHSLALYTGLGSAPLLLRWAEKRVRRGQDALAMLGDFWLLPAALLGHQGLTPIVDAMSPKLRDGVLAAIDLRLFGQHPSALLIGRMPRWATEVLLVCYYGYFVWPLAVGCVLYRTRRAAFREFTLALALTFGATFIGYAWMPAIGPRFFLSHLFSGPLQGGVLTPWLDSAMRTPGFIRDCFPSGHTAITLVVLAASARHHRALFAALLLPSLGLIAATLVGRFHYGVDLLFALPLAAVVWTTATGLSRPRTAVRPARATLSGERNWARA